MFLTNKIITIFAFNNNEKRNLLYVWKQEASDD